jgi:anthranilate phosphoribosyltransferase
MNLVQASRLCSAGEKLPIEVIPLLLNQLLDNATSDYQRFDFLLALSERGETAEELAAFARALMPRAQSPGLSGFWKGQPILDVCGTGGGGLDLVNVSTAIIFILAACGVPVVKHGNRGVTKNSGSADMLEMLGIDIQLKPERVIDCLNEVGVAFLFAPAYHPAFTILGPVRKLLGEKKRRTVLNLLGPLINPVRPAAQMTGVFAPSHLELYSRALELCGRTRYATVCGYFGNQPLGEFSCFGPNLWAGNVARPQLDSNHPPQSLSELLVQSPTESAAWILHTLKGEDKGPVQRLIVANATAALLVQRQSTDAATAYLECNEAVISGRALQVLEKWRKISPLLGED